jgi:ABC-type glycerol-3-phosphate transport system substrate-binding protein
VLDLFSRRLIRRVALLLAAGFVVAACGGSSEPSGEASASAIDFTAETVGGGSIEMADFAGEPLALWFWSPW